MYLFWRFVCIYEENEQEMRGGTTAQTRNWTSKDASSIRLPAPELITSDFNIVHWTIGLLSNYAGAFELASQTVSFAFQTLWGRYWPCGETPRWLTGGRCPFRSSRSPVERHRGGQTRREGRKEMTQPTGDRKNTDKERKARDISSSGDEINCMQWVLSGEL